MIAYDTMTCGNQSHDDMWNPMVSNETVTHDDDMDVYWLMTRMLTTQVGHQLFLLSHDFPKARSQ
jgi:hypothetical protein